ncbi:GM21710 [Drosophila sechellia]|uniref:cyclin-dependent kinase n=1 Tax=Drosophila sechellia TaxID=7238 RepID=B4HT62_DROSE|nr:GM21710 [Drosophila sechellia]
MSYVRQLKRQKMSQGKKFGDGDPFNYQELNIIGEGAYGTVYRARDVVTGNIVALKKVRISLNENGVPMSTLREISLLKQLNASNHANIVKLYEVCQFLERDGQLLILLVFEHVEQDLSGSYRQTSQIGHVAAHNSALVEGTTDRCGLLTLTPHHPSGSEAQNLLPYNSTVDIWSAAFMHLRYVQ